MRIHLGKNPSGQWQADIILPDGRDCHGAGRTPGAALVELGLYLDSLPPPNDLAQLFGAIVAAGAEPT